MSTVRKFIHVEAPLRVVYNQWTQFETFPMFMSGVERVIQVDDRTLDWTASIAGQPRSWRARITEQLPDRVIAWESIDGARNAGSVHFQPVSADVTLVDLELDIEPAGPIEAAGDLVGLVRRQVEGDLERFKAFIEARGHETGAWRGAVGGASVVTPRRPS
ncbi:MAG TPA: SRPBCC family protein [Candidatus Saccharimonadia bacterium]|nr:SRPBCC family protein [Candidatus Saccharimonadia bacterium]